MFTPIYMKPKKQAINILSEIRYITAITDNLPKYKEEFRGNQVLTAPF